MEWKQSLKPIGFIFVVQLATVNSALASLLTFDFEATKRYEQERTYNYENGDVIYGETQYTPIVAVNLDLAFEVDFSSPLDERYPDGVSDEIDEGGKHYSSFSHHFDASLINSTTPFTEELLDLAPKPNDVYYSESSSRISYHSQIVTDMSSGEILQDESYQYFRVNGGLTFQDGSDGLNYQHRVKVWLVLSDLFVDVNVKHYSGFELQQMLIDNQNFEVTFNEDVTVIDNVENDIYKHTLIGFTAKGIHTFEVPEPTSAAIFALAIMGLFSRRAKANRF